MVSLPKVSINKYRVIVDESDSGLLTVKLLRKSTFGDSWEVMFTQTNVDASKEDIASKAFYNHDGFKIYPETVINSRT